MGSARSGFRDAEVSAVASAAFHCHSADRVASVCMHSGTSGNGQTYSTFGVCTRGHSSTPLAPPGELLGVRRGARAQGHRSGSQVAPSGSGGEL